MRLLGRKKSKAAPAFVGAVDAVFPASTPDERVFEGLYKVVREPAIKRARRLVSYETARDALHEVFAELWERRAELQPEERSAEYFGAAVHNRVVSHMRRDRRYVELTGEVEESPEFPALVRGPEGEIDPDPIIAAILKAMPPRRKAAWFLAKYHKRTYEQIASDLGVSVATVDTHLRLARESFRHGLERAGFRLSRGTAVKLIPSKTTEADNG